MADARFQTTLIAALALGLGFSLSSSDAVGYPAGAAVSLGSNPVASFAGEIDGTGSTSLVSVPLSSDFIVTDISLNAKSLDSDCMDMIETKLSTDTADLAVYDMSTRYCYSSNCYSDGLMVNQALESGLLVPAGSTLTLHSNLYNSFTYGGCSSGRETTVKYTIAGYYAQP
jgi:hypothetical protein